MESVESQIAEWRAYVADAAGVNGHDVDELEDHLRHQIADLNAAGLTDDEAFLVAVKRMGDLDALLEGVRTRAQRPTLEAARRAVTTSRQARPATGSRHFSSPQPRLSRSRLHASLLTSPPRNRTGSCGTSVCSCCRSSPGTSPADGKLDARRWG